jgi:hypothetical protein
VPWARALPGQFLRKLQQRVGRAGHDITGDIDNPAAPVPSRRPELLERLPGADPVALGKHADRLLDPDPCGQRMLKLADSGPQPVRLLRRPAISGLGGALGAPGPAPVGLVPGGWQRLRRDCGLDRRLDLGRQLGGDQVSQDHRAGKVGQLVVAYAPPVRSTADYRLLAGSQERLVLDAIDPGAAGLSSGLPSSGRPSSGRPSSDLPSSDLPSAVLTAAARHDIEVAAVTCSSPGAGRLRGAGTARSLAVGRGCRVVLGERSVALC